MTKTKSSFGEVEGGKQNPRDLYAVVPRKDLDRDLEEGEERYKPHATHQLTYADVSVIHWGTESECEAEMLKAMVHDSDVGLAESWQEESDDGA